MHIDNITENHTKCVIITEEVFWGEAEPFLGEPPPPVDRTLGIEGTLQLSLLGCGLLKWVTLKLPTNI